MLHFFKWGCLTVSMSKWQVKTLAKQKITWYFILTFFIRQNNWPVVIVQTHHQFLGHCLVSQRYFNLWKKRIVLVIGCFTSSTFSCFLATGYKSSACMLYLSLWNLPNWVCIFSWAVKILRNSIIYNKKGNQTFNFLLFTQCTY